MARPTKKNSIAIGPAIEPLRAPKDPLRSPKSPLGAPQGKVLPPRLTEKKIRPTEVFQHKLLKKDEYPPRARTAIPDPYADLDEKTKAKLGLWPYGDKIIVDKKDLVDLQNFYLDIVDIAIPVGLISHFEKQHNLIRKIMQLIPLEDLPATVNYTGPKMYSCKCFKSKTK